MRVKITLACTECKQRNYNRRTIPIVWSSTSIAGSAASRPSIGKRSKEVPHGKRIGKESQCGC